ncbi:MAG: hypothetical protein AAF741_09935 [Bacteroidota bacterium]
MRNRIAVWGRDGDQNRVMITLELKTEDNLVHILTYPEKVVTDEVYGKFMTQWRKNQEVELPEAGRSIVRELSVTDSLLPDELKAEQTDMINLAQNEWHYAVLSDKMTKSYLGELAEIGDAIERSGEYDSNTWNRLKSFWEKVQTQLRDKTLLRQHGNKLRQGTDELFNKMKELRSKKDQELREKSQEIVAEFNEKLAKLEGDIEEGSHLRRVFDDLRKVQSKFHNAKFHRKDRDLIYKRIDAAFKAVKAKRGQGGGGNDGGAGRTKKRYDGLINAMERMQNSINRDHKDLEFQRKRITNTDEQMEAEIRRAKIQMIQSRVDSKQEKLNDMLKTKRMLEDRMEKEKKRAEKAKEREAQRKVEAEIKAKLEAERAKKQAQRSEEEKAKLEAAAAAIKEGKKKPQQNAPVAALTSPSDSASDLVENLAAISAVLSQEEE